MDRWRNKVAVVTGASAGIGAAIARELVKNGVITVGLARREDRLLTMAEELKSFDGKFHPIKTDLSIEADIEKAFTWIHDILGGVDILINNAGIIRKNDNFYETETLKQIFQINVFAAQMCIEKAVNSMKSRKVEGHIININSLAGCKVLSQDGNGIWYSTSKHAATLMIDLLRKHISTTGLKIKLTNIYPSEVNTELFEASNVPLTKPKETFLDPEDIVDSVIHVLATKPNVQISDITIVSTGRLF